MKDLERNYHCHEIFCIVKAPKEVVHFWQFVYMGKPVRIKINNAFIHFFQFFLYHRVMDTSKTLAVAEIIIKNSKWVYVWLLKQRQLSYINLLKKLQLESR